MRSIIRVVRIDGMGHAFVFVPMFIIVIVCSDFARYSRFDVDFIRFESASLCKVSKALAIVKFTLLLLSIRAVSLFCFSITHPWSVLNWSTQLDCRALNNRQSEIEPYKVTSPVSTVVYVTW